MEFTGLERLIRSVGKGNSAVIKIVFLWLISSIIISPFIGRFIKGNIHIVGDDDFREKIIVVERSAYEGSVAMDEATSAATYPAAATQSDYASVEPQMKIAV